MTKGFQKIEMESVARLRRNALLARSMEPTDDDRRELERVLATAILLCLLTGAAACRSWIGMEARKAARKLGVAEPAAIPRPPANVDTLIERLSEDPLTMRVAVSAESASQVMSGLVVDQIVRRGKQYTYGFTEQQARDATRLLSRGEHTSPDPSIGSLMSRARDHARVAELAARQGMYIAFNDAVAEVATTPEGRLRFPLWEIQETIDEVTRGNPAGKYPEPHRHFQFSGYVNTIDRIVAQRIVPPNGFNCRAALVPWTHEQADKAGLLLPSSQPNASAIDARNGHRQELIDSGQYPDVGWVRAEA